MKSLEIEPLKDFLDEKVALYNQPSFIESDPIQIPHRFSKKEDIEIAGFLVATIAWGNRKMIIKNALRMMQLMDDAPYDFVLHHKPQHLTVLKTFVHRTFQGVDFVFFIQALQNIYRHYGGLEAAMSTHPWAVNESITAFKKLFFQLPHQQRTTKHIADPSKGSAAKRINMFLRWMVRKDRAGVDFGIWNALEMAQLSCPLDVHSGNVARKLGLLQRKQNDAKAVAALDASLRMMDAKDPVKYDYALFGLGVFEGF